MKVSVILLIAAVFVCAPRFVNAKVKSISAATDTVNTKGDSFQTVQVTCERRSEKFVINRRINSKKWCDSVLTNICHVNKIRLATAVCGRGYARFLATKNIENIQQESIARKLETAVSKSASKQPHLNIHELIVYFVI
jgi:hypothetical protein